MSQTSSPSPSQVEIPTRAGYVAVVGRPNAGKSTLMNTFVGEKLSIVTPKAQTTWKRVTGILTDDTAQIVFVDTPGLLEVKDRLQASMLEEAEEALRDADAVLAVVDAQRFREERDGPVLRNAVSSVSVPVLVAVNKIDQASADQVGSVARWADSLPGTTVYPISALTGQGTDQLLAALKASLPESPFFYPPDEIASEPVRFFVAEMVRETVFELFEQEIPYSVATQVEEFREEQDPVYIQVVLYVDRPPQKRILIGQGGRAIRKLGELARAKIEDFMGRKVYLDLWVKVLPGWRRRGQHLKRLGYRVPREEENVED
jgi:GTP-binding protein Era